MRCYDPSQRLGCGANARQHQVGEMKRGARQEESEIVEEGPTIESHIFQKSAEKNDDGSQPSHHDMNASKKKMKPTKSSLTGTSDDIHSGIRITMRVNGIEIDFEIRGFSIFL